MKKQKSAASKMADTHNTPTIRSFDGTNDHRGSGHHPRPRVQRPTPPTALEDDEIELYSYNGDVEDDIIIRVLSEDGDDDDIYRYDEEHDDVIPPRRAAAAFRDGNIASGTGSSKSSSKDKKAQNQNHQLEEQSVSSEAILRDLSIASGETADDGAKKSHPNSNVLLWKNDENVVTIVSGNDGVGCGGGFDDDGAAEQGFDVQYKERKPSPESSQPKHSIIDCWAILDVFKYTYSLLLLLFSLFILVALIFSEQTFASREGHPIMALVLTMFLLIWLAMIEGGQGCIVGLHPIDPQLYKHSHKLTWTSTSITYKGHNLGRFIIGRQFLVVLVVFAINICNGLVPDNGEGDNIFDSKDDSSSSIQFNEFIPTWLMSMFIKSNIAMILLTTVIGQLTSQINSAYCMLDFINSYLMVFTTYLSLAIEYSGLLHSVYLVEAFFQWVTGSGGNKISTKINNDQQQHDSTDEESQIQIEELQRISRERDEPQTTSEEEWKSNDEMALYIARIMFSLFVLALSFAVTIEALFLGKTAVSQDNIPPYISIIFFICLMIFVGLLEGLQIALFAVKNMPQEELQNHTIARINYEFVFSSNSDDDNGINSPNALTKTNLQSILIGRQILVTLCMFAVARITTITVDVGGSDPNLFYVYDSVQIFFNTGLLGAVITTILGSLIWRIIASSFPIAFLSNPIVYILLRLCLLLEASGVCSSAWVLASIYKSVFDLQEDELYVGKKEERRARNAVRNTSNGGIDNNGTTAIIPQLMTVASGSFDSDDGHIPKGGNNEHVNRRGDGHRDGGGNGLRGAAVPTDAQRRQDMGPKSTPKHAAASTPPPAESVSTTKRTASYRGFDIDKALKRVMDDGNDVANVDAHATDSDEKIGQNDASRYRNINNDLNRLLQEEFETQYVRPTTPTAKTSSPSPMPQSPRTNADSKTKRKWTRR